jgi:DNA-directed RNA polymerase specialized sigma24 family protein
LVRASNRSLDPAQRAKARDEWDIVAKAVNALTEEQRQVLMDD